MRAQILETIKEFSKDEDGIPQYISPTVFGFLSHNLVKKFNSILHDAVLGDVGELVKAQDEYIKFLQDYIGSVDGYLRIHNMPPSKEDIDKGIVLRRKMDMLKPISL